MIENMGPTDNASTLTRKVGQWLNDHPKGSKAIVYGAKSQNGRPKIGTFELGEKGLLVYDGNHELITSVNLAQNYFADSGHTEFWVDLHPGPY